MGAAVGYRVSLEPFVGMQQGNWGLFHRLSEPSQNVHVRRYTEAANMSSLAPRLIVSEEEFLSLPESTEKVELVDGEVILSPSPSYRHQWILRQIVRALEDWAATQNREVTVGMAPLDVRFSPGRIMQPDAFVLFARIAPDHAGPISEVPALCVEVMSSNRAYDRMTKRLVYAEAGVAELWTIGTDGVVERWCGDRLSDSEVPVQYLTSPLLPGFLFAIDKLQK